jgi:hypothetical protein
MRVTTPRGPSSMGAFLPGRPAVAGASSLRLFFCRGPAAVPGTREQRGCSTLCLARSAELIVGCAYRRGRTLTPRVLSVSQLKKGT